MLDYFHLYFMSSVFRHLCLHSSFLGWTLKPASLKKQKQNTCFLKNLFKKKNTKYRGSAAQPPLPAPWCGIGKGQGPPHRQPLPAVFALVSPPGTSAPRRVATAASALVGELPTPSGLDGWTSRELRPRLRSSLSPW